MVEKESLNLINVLQNPSIHYLGNREYLLKKYNIDARNEARWIAFEDKFSIENFSGLSGKGLYEIAVALTVINMQGGVTSKYIDKLTKIPKDKITRIYYKHQKERKKSYSKDAYKVVCHWLNESGYISELELNRLLDYDVFMLEEKAILDDFNHDLLKNELKRYAQEYWNAGE